MSMVIRKKQLLAITLALALGSAVFVNRYYTGMQNTDADEQQTIEQQYTQENLGDSMLVQASTAEEEEKEDEEQTTKEYTSTAGSVAQYFTSAELNRDKAHDEIKTMIQQVCDNENADDDLKQKAKDSLDELTEEIKLQSDTENLIKAKLSCQCIVAINNGKAQIVVSPGVLDTVATLQISEIIKEQTGIKGENISIIEAK